MDRDNLYGMRGMHIELLRLLLEFDTICKSNQIVYSLGFGSMLGAVRDHGIIPWDDDVDVIIDRNNYRKLESIIDLFPAFIVEKNSTQSLWVPRFRYRDKGHEEFGYTLTIDLFIIDNVPDSKILSSTILFMTYALQGMIKSKLNLKKGNCFQKVASVTTYLAGRMIPLSVKFWLYHRLADMSNGKMTHHCTCYMAEFNYVAQKNDSRLLKDITVMDFDDLKVPISAHYDSYLTTLYSDYMTPPKNTERIAKLLGTN